MWIFSVDSDMTDWSMVWLQQKGDDEETFTPRVPDPTKPLSLELQRSVTNLQRNTKARQAKVENIWLKRSRVLSYVNQGKYVILTSHNYSGKNETIKHFYSASSLSHRL